jgi:hypothetical protein
MNHLLANENLVAANGIEYTIVRGSDVDRDGMYLELTEKESKKGHR